MMFRLVYVLLIEEGRELKGDVEVPVTNCKDVT